MTTPRMRNVACLLLLTLAALAVVPSATAVVTITPDCEVVLAPRIVGTIPYNVMNWGWSYETSFWGHIGGLTVTNAGNLVTQFTLATTTNPSTNGPIAYTQSFTTACNTQWQKTLVCSGPNTCLKDGPAYLPSGTLALIAETGTTNPATIATYQKLSTTSGNIVNGFPPFGVTITGSNAPIFAGTTPVTVASDGFIFAGAEQTIWTDESGQRWEYFNDTGSLGVQSFPALGFTREAGGLYADPGSNPFGYQTFRTFNNVGGGTGVAIQKIDLIAHTSLAAAGIAGQDFFFGMAPPDQMSGAGNSGKLVTLGQSAGGVQYGILDKAAMTTVGTLVGFFPGGSRAMWHDADGSNGELICGLSDTAGNTAAFFYTDGTAAVAKVIDVPLSSVSPITAGGQGGGYYFHWCNFDNNGGLWAVAQVGCTVSGVGTNIACMDIRHFTTNLVQPALRALDPTIYPNPDASSTTTAPTGNLTSAGGGLLSFASSIGFTTAPDLFLFGLILIIIVMVITFLVCSAAVRGTKGKGSLNGHAVMGIGIVSAVAGLGMMLFCAIVGFWDFITTVLIALVAAAIVAAAARKWTTGTGGSG